MKKCPKCKCDKDDDQFYKDRKVKSGLHTYCKDCCKEKSKGRYAQDPEKHKAVHREWVLSNRDRVRAHKAKSAYGITYEEYHEMMKNPCAICGTTDKLVVDHCHETGAIRGTLCSRCNSAIGFLLDDVSLVRSALSYLEGFESEHSRTTV